MSLILAFKTIDDEPIANGVCVVIDGAKARVYDDQVDAASDIFGVVCPKTRLAGREIIGGEAFYQVDYYEFSPYHDFAEENGNYVENVNYDPDFDTTTDSTYVYVLYIGLGVVNSDQEINPIWKLIDANHSASTKLYLLH